MDSQITDVERGGIRQGIILGLLLGLGLRHINVAITVVAVISATSALLSLQVMDVVSIARGRAGDMRGRTLLW